MKSLLGEVVLLNNDKRWVVTSHLTTDEGIDLIFIPEFLIQQLKTKYHEVQFNIYLPYFSEVNGGPIVMPIVQEVASWFKEDEPAIFRRYFSEEKILEEIKVIQSDIIKFKGTIGYMILKTIGQTATRKKEFEKEKLALMIKGWRILTNSKNKSIDKFDKLQESLVNVGLVSTNTTEKNARLFFSNYNLHDANHFAYQFLEQGSDTDTEFREIVKQLCLSPDDHFYPLNIYGALV